MKCRFPVLTATVLVVVLPNSFPTTATAMPADMTAHTGAARLVIPVAHRKPHKKSRKSELDRSIDNGTVPARYRSSIPKEYQQYIPFEKRGR